MLDEQIEHAVDARPPGGTPKRAQLALDPEPSGRVTPRNVPNSSVAGVAISSLIAVAATWGGLALSYEISSLPPSSAIIGLAAAAFAIASVLARSHR